MLGTDDERSAAAPKDLGSLQGEMPFVSPCIVRDVFVRYIYSS